MAIDQTNVLNKMTKYNFNTSIHTKKRQF